MPQLTGTALDCLGRCHGPISRNGARRRRLTEVQEITAHDEDRQADHGPSSRDVPTEGFREAEAARHQLG